MDTPEIAATQGRPVPRTGLLYLFLNILPTIYLAAFVLVSVVLPGAHNPNLHGREALWAWRVGLVASSMRPTILLIAMASCGILTAFKYRSRWGAAVAAAILILLPIKYALMVHH